MIIRGFIGGKVKRAFLIIMAVAITFSAANNCFADEVEKNARNEVNKALKGKLIDISDLTKYYERINKGKGADVIKELQLLASQEGSVSDKNPVGWRFDGSGKSTNVTPPLSWGISLGGSKKNISWVMEMPGYSPSSVIVVGDKLFSGSNHYSLVCQDKKSGKILWVGSVSPYDAAEKAERDQKKDVFSKLDELAKKRDGLNSKIPGASPNEIFSTGSEVVKVEQEMEKLLYPSDMEKYKGTGMTGSDGGYMSTTPASDGTFVYAWNAWGVTACFDMKGERKWIRFDKLRPQEHGHYGAPLLIGDKVIIHIGRQYRALDKKTGKELWTSESHSADWTGYWYGSHLKTRIGSDDVMIAGDGSLIRPSDGKRFFKAKGMQSTSPVFGNGYVSWVDGPGQSAPRFYKLPSSVGSSDSPKIKSCSFKRAKEIKPSGGFFSAASLIVNGLLYTMGGDPVLYVYDLAADKLVYQKELDFGETPTRQDRPYGCGISSSPSLAGGKIYIWGNFGTTIIIEPGPVYKEIGKNTIDTRFSYNWKNGALEGTVSNPWFEGKRIYYRAQKYMYCIEEK